MSRQTYPLVTYPDVKIDGVGISVEALSEADTKHLVPHLYRLMIATYSPQFEGIGKPLPAGSFDATYGFDHLDDQARAERLSRYTSRIKRHYAHGGSYHAVFDPIQGERLIGTLKVLPGGIVEPRFTRRYGLAEILVDPDFQGNGLGAAMLHASVTYGPHQDISPDQGAVLEAFDDNPGINGWYSRLNFVPEEPSDALVLSDGYALSTTYYVTAAGTTLAGTTHMLEAAHPQLVAHDISHI